MTLLGAVEMGGTTTNVAVGTSLDDLSPTHRIATTGPDETLGAVVEFLAGHDLAAVGAASFGPLELNRSSPRFGTMLFTPKPGWSGTPVYQHLHSRLGVPVVVDTDVNGAAVGEGHWGAAQGMANHAYVTVGTGIGAGIVIEGNLLHGEGHPELGHVTVRRLPGDQHQGSCPYHGDCLEGMAAGPALEARFGRPGTWAGNDQVVGTAAGYLAQGLLNLVYTTAPERIVVGGGVSRLPGLHERLRDRLGPMLAGYPRMPDLDLLVSPPGLGDRSALAGGLILAARGLD